jgi:hypothetical protein
VDENRIPTMQPTNTPSKVAMAGFVALSVALSGDTLQVGGASGEPGSAVIVPMRVQGAGPIVALQFDLVHPQNHLTPGLATAASATTDHRAESSPSTGRLKVVVHSPTNRVLPADLEISVPIELTADAPSGGPSLTVANLLFSDAQGNSVAPNVTYPPVETWRRQNFSEAERADSQIIGDNRDPDGDRLSNLAEYALGSNPKQPDADRLPVAGSLIDAGTPYLTLTFRKLKSATGAEFQAVASDNLQTWATDGVTTEPTGNEDAQSTEFRARVSKSDGNRRFLRITFQRAPGN